MALAVVRSDPALTPVEAPLEAPLENLPLEGHGGDGRDEQSTPFGPPSSRSKIGLQSQFHGGELKAQIDAMLLFAVEVIYDQPVPRLDEEHTAAMLQRILPVGIGIVLDVGEVDIVVREPLTQVRLRMAVPSERPCRNGLVQSVDAHRAVRSGAPEVIAPVRLGGVAVCARIDDELLAKCRAMQAEEIGVAMTGGGWAADGAGVEDQMLRLRVPATAHHHVAAVREAPRRRAGRKARGERVEGIDPHRSEHPEYFRCHAAGPEVVRSSKESGGH